MIMGGFSAWQETLHTDLLQVLSHCGIVRKHFRVFLAWSASGESPHWTPPGGADGLEDRESKGQQAEHQNRAHSQNRHWVTNKI